LEVGCSNKVLVPERPGEREDGAAAALRCLHFTGCRGVSDYLVDGASAAAGGDCCVPAGPCG
jgi:hypothetical protein